MNNKKTFGLFLVALVLFSIIPFALADDLSDEEISQSTEMEVSSMNNPFGAEVRLLQLEKSIQRNILVGNEIVSYLSELGKDSSELDSLLNELGSLKLEVQDLDPSLEDSVETFVNIKKEAIEISKEFREEVRSLLNDEELIELRSRISEVDRSEIQEYSDQIRERIHAYNAESLSEVFEILGIDDEEFISGIENGEITLVEVRERIRSALEEMDSEQRREAWAQLKESNLRKNIFAKQRIENARNILGEWRESRDEWVQRASERINDPQRRERVERFLESESERLMERANRIAHFTRN